MPAFSISWSSAKLSDSPCEMASRPAASVASCGWAQSAAHWSQSLTLAASAASAYGAVTNVSFFDGAVELGRCAQPLALT